MLQCFIVVEELITGFELVSSVIILFITGFIKQVEEIKVGVVKVLD